MLTTAQNSDNVLSVTAKSVAGVSPLKYPERIGAHSIALFLCPQFMAGVMGALSSAPLLWGGRANPVASATLLLSPNGGGSETNPEDTVMLETACAEWHVPSIARRTVDGLSFTSRDPDGGICWWDVTPPKTDYWHAHEMLGRAHALELIDLMGDCELDEHTFASIATEIVRRGHTMNEGLYYGFFCAISEYLITGEVDR